MLLFLKVYLLATMLAEDIESTTSTDSYIPACNSTIFCGGEVLKKVQMSEVFKDSKTFVDMPLKVEYNSTIENEILHNQTKEELLQVIEKYFNKAGEELEPVNITTATSEPEFLKKIKSTEYKEWAIHLCSIWKKLVRKMKKDVKTNAERYSLIYMDKSFVVPGGRFREMYYWDTYWSIEGLLLCEMYDTTHNILENLLNLVEEIGFVPNGGRKYYQNRSQPPFLTLMVHKYLSYTNDTDFVKKHMGTLIKEYNFWMKQRTVTFKSEHLESNRSFTFNLYQSMMGDPRPESYREDVELMTKAGLVDNTTAQKELYSHIASAAESGWDFSSRWFKEDLDMTTIQTRNIIPVDLNSILCAVEFTLAKFYRDIIQNETKANAMFASAVQRRGDIDEFFWNEEYQLWLDYDYNSKKFKKSFYASSLYPLWSYTAHSAGWNKIKANKAYEKMKSIGVFDHVGGLPTSLITSGQQWDFPNAWPPLQHIAVHGLTQVNINENNDVAKKTALNLAKKFLETTYLSWKTTGHMYEKYDVRERMKAGGGGEYEVQEGFGWTNGVVLNLLDKYGDVLEAPSESSSASTLYNTFCVFVVMSVSTLSHLIL